MAHRVEFADARGSLGARLPAAVLLALCLASCGGIAGTLDPSSALPVASIPGPSGPGSGPSNLSPLPSGTRHQVALGGDITLAPGDVAAIAGLPVEVTLVEAHGPRDGCNDCPNEVVLSVRSSAAVERLSFSIGGGMLPELLEQARQQTAFGVVFYIASIEEGSARIRVLAAAGPS